MELFANNIKVPFSDKISLKFFNPLFNDIGSHSFPVSFSSKLPVVNKAFGFPVNKETPGASYISARIKDSIIDLIGSWQVTETNKSTIEAYYKGSNGDFYSMIKDNLLTGIDFGGIKYPAGVGADVGTVLAHMTTKMNPVYPTDEWAAFLAYMPNTCDGSDEEVNPVSHDEGTGIPRFTNVGILNSTVYLFVGTVIDYIFAEYGYRIEKNIFREDADLKQLVIFNTFNRCASDAFDYSKLVPRITIKDFLKAIRNRFNIGFFINEQSRSVKILSFNSIRQRIPGGKIIARDLILDKNRVGGFSFPVSAPDEWCDNDYGSLAELDPAGTEVTVDKYEDIFIMIDEHPGDIIGKNVYVTADSNYYYVASAEVVERKCANQFPYISGDGSLEIEQLSGIPAMFTLDKNFETLVEYVIPRCDLTSNASGFPYTDYPLMFLFARGKQDCYVFPLEGAFARQYPQGTNEIYDANGVAITGANLALRWQGENGLIERLWEDRIAWELYIKKIVKSDFGGFDLNKLLDFSSVIRGGDSNYIINSLSVELSNKIARITEAELFRL